MSENDSEVILIDSNSESDCESMRPQPFTPDDIRPVRVPNAPKRTNFVPLPQMLFTDEELSESESPNTSDEEFIDDGPDTDLDPGHVTMEAAPDIRLEENDAVLTVLPDVKGDRKRKSFRLQAKRVFLTYSDCQDLEMEDVVLFLTGSVNPVSLYFVGQEEHRSGARHYHCYVEYKKKIHTRDPNYFDILVKGVRYHPNVQAVKNKSKCIEYVTKGGNFRSSRSFDYSSHVNFIKRYRDFEAWRRHTEPAAIFPSEGICCPAFGLVFSLPDATVKRRSLWLYGPPDAGKTYNILSIFTSGLLYPVPKTKYPFEDYNGQPYILYDDHFPCVSTFVDILQVYPESFNRKHVAGDTRYYPVFWPTLGMPGGVRSIIVLANHEPDYGSASATFAARFYTIRLAWSAVCQNVIVSESDDQDGYFIKD